MAMPMEKIKEIFDSKVIEYFEEEETEILDNSGNAINQSIPPSEEEQEEEEGEDDGGVE